VSSTRAVADGLLGLLARLGVELLAGLVLRGEELAELVLVVVEGVHRVVGAGLDLGGDDRLRQRHLGVLDELVQETVTGLRGLLHPLGPAQTLAQVLGQLVERVELRGQLGELVVGLGEVTLLHGGHLDGDLRILVGVLTGDQLRGEGLLLVGRHALEGLVDAVDETALADLVGEAGGGGLLDLLAVDGGGEIDLDVVTGLRGTLDTRQGAEPGAQLVELLGDLVLGHLGLVDLDGQAVQVGEGDLGADVDLGGERDALAVGDLGDLDVGPADRLDVLGRHHGLLVLHRDRGVHDLVQDGATADPGLQDAGRRLARAEAGDADLLGDLLVRAVEVGLELVERHLDVDPDARRAEGARRCSSRWNSLGGTSAATGRGSRGPRSVAPPAGAGRSRLCAGRPVPPAAGYVGRAR
jgi:hypothetical protein